MAASKESEKLRLTRFLPIPLFILVGYSSYWITVRTMDQETEPTPLVTKRQQLPLVSPKKPLVTERNSESKEEIDQENAQTDELKNQRAVTFKDAESMRRFLAKLGKDVQLLGRIDALNTVLVGFVNTADLDALLDGDQELSAIYPVRIPGFENVGPQDGAVPLNNSLLQWLGVESDNSLWGKGLVIAVLDTGIADHMAFKNPIKRINLVPLPSDPSLLNGHGTAVASLIFSNNRSAPGVAPGATPLSVRIADDSGYSNSFLIAQGIIAAVDAGAHIINISMGGTGNSSLVNQALEYAKQSGVVVVAAAGNTGTQGVLQPAAHPSVIAVGSVDAKNQAMNFSTSGNEVAISGPGYGIYAAYPGNMAASVTGTSFSAPIITGVVAAVATSSGSQTMNIQQAANLVLNNLTDVGTMGADPYTGGGVPDMTTLMNLGTRGRYDVSVNSIYVGENQQLNVLVQNLGTETLINTGITVNINGTNVQGNVTTLAPMESRAITVPFNATDSINVSGSAQLSGQTDQRLENNSLSVQIVPNP